MLGQAASVSFHVSTLEAEDKPPVGLDRHGKEAGAVAVQAAQAPGWAREVFLAGCSVQGRQHFPQALGVNRLDSGLRARAKEGFKPLVSERDNHRLYICDLQSTAHCSHARV